MTCRLIMDLSLDTYRLLGRSGLRVSPLALGVMTFGDSPTTRLLPEGGHRRPKGVGLALATRP